MIWAVFINPNPDIIVQLRLIATCAFGLEAVVKRELIALGFPDPKVVTPGRIAFDGDWESVCLTNLWLRVADRILIEVLRFDAPDFDALFDTVKDFDWSTYLPGDAKFPVVGKSRKSQLTSVPAVQRTVKKALVESLLRTTGQSELPETGAEYKVEIALLNDEATVSIDTTGRSLHKRGYRKLVGEAPLKETLAAAMIKLSVWKPSRMLVDPFCGSGTIPIEAALIGRNIAPGLNRDFSSSEWTQIPAAIWEERREAARQQIDRDVELQIIGTDRDSEVLSLARYHARQAEVDLDIHFQQKNFDELRSKHEYGCVICNPPYGERLEVRKRLLGLYQSFPGVLQRLPTWSHFIITNLPGFQGMLQTNATRRRKLYNGRIECTYYQFLGPRPPRPTDSETADAKSTETNSVEPISEESKPADQPVAASDVAPKAVASKPTPERSDPKPVPAPPAPKPKVKPVFGGLQEKDHEQAELFASRLRKRARHLRRWPTKRGISCFRLYERDIPELPLVVDRYDDCLHITEYERPHERDAGRHASWLELMKKTAAKTLEIPIQRVFLKTRLKTKGRQYQKVDQSQKMFTVQEDGLNFLVNLSDYVDTGLFLDHRVTRKMVRDTAQGKHFLNLFAYTGSFSVYAAAGGAKSTTTVDWSRNYLEWAQKNLAANGFEGHDHQFVASDTMDFLQSNDQKFDLVVVDPPTYSNRKGAEDDWDVQACHVELLSLVGERLSPNATVFFSTNYRKFKLNEAALANFSIREISQQTVPEDFRNRKIHRCWLLTN
jgi:23S rRNA (guanine2445-N2)-methyltransferase / 23S rRNA (guanine2069-N7)-methyltransferase